MDNLETTNLLLGIMAAVSVLEALLLIGVGIGAYIVYKRVTDLIATVEQRHVAPAMARVNAILDDAKDVAAKVRAEADRIDDTADRVRATLRAKANNVIGHVRGVRAAIEAMLRFRARSSEL